MGLDTVELIFRIEKEFAITISNSEAEKIFTVKDIYQVVLQHLPAGTDGQEVYKKVVEIISDQSGIDTSDIYPHHSITSDLGMD